MLSGKIPSLAARASQRLHSIKQHIQAAATTSEARPVGRLREGETAVFVCDVQERFRPVISGFPAVVDAASRLVRGAEALSIPVVVTEQYPKALGNTVDELKRVLPKDALVQDKNSFSMLVEPVKEHLKQRLSSVKQVLLVGIEAHVCVFQTVADLVEEGYEVHLVVDAVSSQRFGDRAIAIQRIAQMGGFLVSSEMALFQLCGSSKAVLKRRPLQHPAFKAISALVKEERPEPLPSI